MVERMRAKVETRAGRGKSVDDSEYNAQVFDEAVILVRYRHLDDRGKIMIKAQFVKEMLRMDKEKYTVQQE